MTHYILAIDQGTTSSRAMVFGADTSVAAVAQREFTQHFPADGEVEHDPEDIWTTTLDTCRGALHAAGLTARDIAAIGIANQRETDARCGIAPPAARCIAPSSGRTGAPRACARN